MSDPASVPLFRLEVARLRRHFTVLWLRGTEAICEPYAFDLEIVSEGPAIDAASLMYKPAFISFKGSAQGFHGLILAVTRSHYQPGPACYRIQIGPRLTCLTQRGSWRVFQHLSATQIIACVLEENGLREGAYRFDLKAECREREVCTQHQESDLQFIQRLLSEEGLHYHFSHARQGHVLVIGEGLRGFARSPVAPWRHLSEQAGITRFCVNSTGQDRPGSRASERAEGASTLSFVSAGQLLPLVDHPLAAWNHMWLVTRVEHSAPNAEGAAEEPYCNRFQAIPWEVGFSVPAPPCRSPAPDLRRARVVGRKGEEAQRDRYRRVLVRFDPDTHSHALLRNDCWLPLAPGLELPVYAGMPVAVGFLGGDIDRPLIVAGLHDGPTGPAEPGQNAAPRPECMQLHLDPRMWLGETRRLALEGGPLLELLDDTELTVTTGLSELRLDKHGLTLTGPRITFCGQPVGPDDNETQDSTCEPAAGARQAPGDAAQAQPPHQSEDEEGQP
jgi:type VI secretion system secreted protein VgrG